MDLDTDGTPLFDDGEHILYVNGACRGDSDIGRLMHDFNCWNPEDMKLSEMKEVTRYYKETQEGVESMCRAFEETRREGALQHAIDTASRLIVRGKLTLEEIAEDTDLPLEKVQELAGTKTA